MSNDDPIYLQALQQFEVLYERAKQTDTPDATAVTLATADRAGRPSARTVLLKAHDKRGFVFYTNNQSRKGEQLKANPNAALLFFWQALYEQALIEGPVEVVSDPESDAYWASRSRESRIGAWASDQSRPVESRAELEARVEAVDARFAGVDVPRPPHWHGFRVVPQRMEFWQGGDHRLHDRQCYRRIGAIWHRELLNP
ncbi:MAG: pyridoxamine 5'-phosphate oxidase [Pseudomonadota bacterium]